ncbi:MAG: zinc-ribbon domain-containing protein [Bacteroidaceae bacterium]|nr:zinc-ribbon domain-containing protein [Bacteroidaceae bacterium]
MYCIYCGAKIDDDSRFCPLCGKPTGVSETTNAVNSDPLPQVTVEQPQPQVVAEQQPQVVIESQPQAVAEQPQPQVAVEQQPQPQAFAGQQPQSVANVVAPLTAMGIAGSMIPPTETQAPQETAQPSMPASQPQPAAPLQYNAKRDIITYLIILLVTAGSLTAYVLWDRSKHKGQNSSKEKHRQTTLVCPTHVSQQRSVNLVHSS